MNNHSASRAVYYVNESAILIQMIIGLLSIVLVYGLYNYYPFSEQAVTPPIEKQKQSMATPMKKQKPVDLKTSNATSAKQKKTIVSANSLTTLNEPISIKTQPKAVTASPAPKQIRQDKMQPKAVILGDGSGSEKGAFGVDFEGVTDDVLLSLLKTKSLYYVVMNENSFFRTLVIQGTSLDDSAVTFQDKLPSALSDLRLNGFDNKRLEKLVKQRYLATQMSLQGVFYLSTSTLNYLQQVAKQKRSTTTVMFKPYSKNGRIGWKIIKS